MAGVETLPFGEFFAVLEARGFTITLEHHLRVARLLERTGPALAPERLKGVLGPIFATNAGEQEAFHAAFESYFGALLTPASREGPVGDELAPMPSDGAWRQRRRLVWLIIVNLALAAVLLVVWRMPRATPAAAPARGSAASPHAEHPPVAPTPAPPTAPAVGTPKPATPAATTPGEPPGAAAETGAAPAGKPEVPLATPETPAESPTEMLHRHRREWGREIVVLALIAFAGLEWRLWRKRDLLIKRARKRRPPFSWPVRVAAPMIRDFQGQRIADVARPLRRRQAGDTERLDVWGTIRATIRAAGLPRFVYQRGSRVPEYLMLIDSASPRDHQAAYFDQLATALSQEGLFVARYYFRGDPRICWDADASVSLADLRLRHPEHRLLVFGDGAGFLDPLTGAPAAWLPLLLEWREVALLTPHPSSRWGLREETLETLLPVAPARLDALAELPDLFERGTFAASLRTWPDTAPPLPKMSAAVPVETLRGYLGPAVFEWLCACAIYPELQWNLTIFLGAQCANAGDLLTEATLARLTRLPWFREGVMPDELRTRLLAELPAERQLVFRRALIELLAANPPPRGTHAADAREIDIAIQRHWIGKSGPAAASRPSAIAELPFGDQTREYAELQLHERSAGSRLGFLLPGRLRDALRDKAVAPLGFRPVIRFVVAMLLALVAWLAIDRTGEPRRTGRVQAAAEKVDFSQNPFSEATGPLPAPATPGQPAVATPGPVKPAPEPENRFEELIAQGKELRERGDMASAIRKLREAIALDPKNALPLAELAATYEKMGLADKAAEQWRDIEKMGYPAGTYYILAEEKLKNAAAPPAASTPGPSQPGSQQSGSPYAATSEFTKYAMKLRESAIMHMEPQVIIPTGSRVLGVSGKYPWKTQIVTTVFWIGQTEKGKKARKASAWDANWEAAYGGFDNPNPAARHNFIPGSFVPRQNPFYIALPYNDVTHGATKPEARIVIPWFREMVDRGEWAEGQSVCRNRWLAIRNSSGKTCYAQWSDCGPFRTDHWQYVFGNEKPRPNLENGAGLQISPAVRDYLELSSTDVTDWKFVEVSEVPTGPWALYGDNNTVAQASRRNQETYVSSTPIPTAPTPPSSPAGTPPSTGPTIIQKPSP